MLAAFALSITRTIIHINAGVTQHFRLPHIPPVLPHKAMSPSFWAERFEQSIDALQEIALQTRGVAGRNNIIWVGHGAPGFNMMGWPAQMQKPVEQYLHATTNMLVDSRVSLYVIYPA